MEENEFDGLSAEDITLNDGSAAVETTETTEESETTAGEESEESSAEETPESTEAVEETTTAPNLDELLATESGGTFKTYADLQARLEELQQNQRTAQDDLDNDLITKFHAFRQNREGDQTEIAKLFLESQVADYSKMEPMDVLRAKMRMDYPNRSKEDIEFLLQNRYKLDPDEYEDNELRLAKLQMEDDAQVARKDLEKSQKEIALANASQSETDNEEKVKAANEKWQTDVNQALDGFDTLEIRISETADPFKFGIENGNDIKSVMSNLPTFWNRYINADGSENIELLKTDMAFLLNREKIMQEVAKHGQTLGRDEILDRRRNPDKEVEGNPDPAYKSELDEIASGFASKIN